MATGEVGLGHENPRKMKIFHGLIWWGWQGLELATRAMSTQVPTSQVRTSAQIKEIDPEFSKQITHPRLLLFIAAMDEGPKYFGGHAGAAPSEPRKLS